MNSKPIKELETLREFLDEKYYHYNSPAFIEQDPVKIPHQFTKKEDREIAGFLAATIAWGNRKSIIQNAQKLMDWMDQRPHDFILHHSKKDRKPFEKFVHRTFNGKDCQFFLESLQQMYLHHGGLEQAFSIKGKQNDLKNNIAQFRDIFLQPAHLKRTEKHISNPLQKSSAKRLCMFLRWMVRKDKKGVDFGIWKTISASELCLPLDVHTGNVSRALGLLMRKQNDWQAVEEVTAVLRRLDEKDPVKYDFALFGLGVDGFLK
jgi:uncharacterized protein (TIGR02757 family)